MSDPRFEGQRLYPEYMVKQIATAWEYQGGIWNAWLEHVDQTAVPSVGTGENTQPFLMSTTVGGQWYFGLEPYGPSYATSKILFFDAHTGKLSIYTPSKPLISPAKALEFVHGAWPSYSWGEGKDAIVAIEPLPILTKSGMFYWQVSITTGAYAGVTQIALVDGDGTKVLWVADGAELKAFINGTFAGRLPASGQPVQQTPGATAPAPAVDSDLKGLSNEELLKLIQAIAQELQSRGGK